MMEILWAVLIGLIVLGCAVSALLGWLRKRKNRKDEWL